NDDFTPVRRVGEAKKEQTRVWAWGSTGEEKWNPDMEIGMDWKSLVRSALLPITTDYFPDRLTLISDYLYTEHQISVVHEHGSRVKMDINQLSRLVFDQLICQRLQRGFQIILMSKPLIHVRLAYIPFSCKFEHYSNQIDTCQFKLDTFRVNLDSFYESFSFLNLDLERRF
ncbi:unnamed protein product, partial [Heligmosomoides polygyrus]|uniref:Neur_chan_LBD domain-containing protein n=1 Tax=Heligmosomoides polygyrus TaxID=6339 RepID=A0A183G999_HELPZ